MPWVRPPGWRRRGWRPCAAESGRPDMDRERWIRRTLALQSVPAPTFEERDRAEALRRELESAGVSQLIMDEAGNVCACVAGGEMPPLVVSAHLDTVFPRETDLANRRTQNRL